MIKNRVCHPLRTIDYFWGAKIHAVQLRRLESWSNEIEKLPTGQIGDEDLTRQSGSRQTVLGLWKHSAGSRNRDGKSMQCYKTNATTFGGHN